MLIFSFISLSSSFHLLRNEVLSFCLYLAFLFLAQSLFLPISLSLFLLQAASKIILRNHVKTVHEGIKYYCTECDFRYTFFLMRSCSFNLFVLHHSLTHGCNQFFLLAFSLESQHLNYIIFLLPEIKSY